MEILKSLSGLAGSLAALAEWRLFPLLPINPGIRDDMVFVGCLFAALAGFGTYRLKTAKAGWWALGCAFVFLVVVVAAGQGTFDTLNPKAVSVAVRVAYVGFFAGVGGAVGGFVR
jgi:uncharacterized membrane protein